MFEPTNNKLGLYPPQTRGSIPINRLQFGLDETFTAKEFLYMALISLQDVSLGFGGPRLLGDVNLQIERGDLGPEAELEAQRPLPMAAARLDRPTPRSTSAVRRRGAAAIRSS